MQFALNQPAPPLERWIVFTAETVKAAWVIVEAPIDSPHEAQSWNNPMGRDDVGLHFLLWFRVDNKRGELVRQNIP